MMYLVWFLFILTSVMALVTNPDVLSPAKMFLATFCIFHIGGIISGVEHYELWSLVLLVLIVGIMIVFFEGSGNKPSNLKARIKEENIYILEEKNRDRHFVKWIWFFSLPALLSQAFMIQYFGGIEGYFNVISLRVLEWQGLGWARTMISTLMPINLAYFAIGLIRSRSRTWWTLYGFHFACLFIIGLLSGSRSGLLNIIALQIFCFHYVKGRIKIYKIFSVVVVLLLAALILGVARENLKYEDAQVVTGLDGDESSLKISTLNSGIDPLYLLVTADSIRLAYGSTFISMLTNIIPRKWWPEKPDTGGVYFTKVFTGDAWEGASNLTPTYLGEWVMNFGWIVGLFMFMISYSLIFYFITLSYKNVAQRLQFDKSHRSIFDFLIYLTVMWASVALMVGEVTNIILTTLISQIIPLIFMRNVLSTRKRSFNL